MTDRLDLLPRHRKQIEALLQEHVPDAEVWAYGSRVNGQSHEASDLDLVLRGPNLQKIDTFQLVGLTEAFTESNIPFLVEARDWARLPESFHREIERCHSLVQKAAMQPSPEGRRYQIEDSPDHVGWLYEPHFPEHWKRCDLYSLAEWVNGLAFKKIQFSEKGLPVIKIAEIKNGISNQTKYTQDTFDESVRVSDGDLLFSWSGQPETSIGAFRWNGPEGWQALLVVATEGIVDGLG